MIDKIIKVLLNLILVAVVIAGIFYWQRPIIEKAQPLFNGIEPYITRFINNLNYQLESLQTPCQKPITYSINSIDQKFNLSNEEIQSALKQASEIWSKPLNKELFAYATTSGQIKINFAYDYRQETTEKLKKLGITLENSQKSYDEMKAKYESLDTVYQKEKIAVANLIKNFNNRKAAYTAEVEKWNAQGGAPEGVYEKLSETQKSLQTETVAINARTDKLNEMVDELNALGSTLNRLARELNLNVKQYNTTGATTGQVFQEGVYIQDETGRRIEVYEFADRNQLVRLLAHEFGHALNLQHTSGTKDIMYYLNEAGNDSLTESDLKELKDKCRIK